MPHALSAEAKSEIRLFKPREHRLAELLGREFPLYAPPQTRMVGVVRKGGLVCVENTGTEHAIRGGTSKALFLFRVAKARDKVGEGVTQVGKPIRIKVKGRLFPVRVKMLLEGVWDYTDGYQPVLKRIEHAA